jgi:predicted  nucleic acid-binding Zn-ribbon protein
MSFSKEVWDAVRRLSALEARTEDVRSVQERIEGKLDDLLQRMARLEVRQQEMRESLRNQILADIKADLVRADVAFRELQSQLEAGKPDGTPAIPPSAGDSDSS